MGLRIVCEVRASESKLSFTWAEGAGSFDAYEVDGPYLERFRRNAAAARVALGDLVDIYNALVMDVPARARCFFQIAQAGNGLYQDIFRPPKSKEPESWLNDARKRDQIESLEIVLHAETGGGRDNLNVPWNLIYGASPRPQDFVGNFSSSLFDPFWGRAYNLACGLRVDPLRRRPQIENPHLLFVIDRNTENTMAETDPAAQRRLRDFVELRNVSVARTKEELIGKLNERRPDIIYWFSHATPEELYLDDAKLSAFDLFLILDSPDNGKRGGLMFLNACQTLGNARQGLAFLNNITTCGMSGIVGTEHETIDLYANRLGLDFLTQFLDGGGGVAEILTGFRRKEPFALLYATYCPPHITVSNGGSPKPAAPAAAADPVAELEPFAGNRLGAAASTQAVIRPLPPSPYIALASYTRKQRALFAGRRDDCDRFAAILNAPSTRILVLQGASGVGKTSFLQAEVIPFLEEESIGYRFLRNRRPPPNTFSLLSSTGANSDDDDEGDSGILFVRAGKDLVGELSQAIWDFAAAPYQLKRPNGEQSQVNLMGIVNAESAAEGGIESSAMLASSVRANPACLRKILTGLTEALPFSILLIIDQAEEIFTQSQGPDALAVLSAIGADAGGDYKLIVSLRTEYYGRLISAMRRGKLKPDAIREYLLVDFGEDDLADAIERPTSNKRLPYSSEIPSQAYRFRYEGEAGEFSRRLAREVRDYAARSQDSILPLVQVICKQLWDRVDARTGEARVVTDADLRAIGGVAGGMARHVEGLIEKLFPSRRDRKAFRRLMARLVLEQSDGTLTTAIVEESVLAGEWHGKTRFAYALVRAAKPEYRLLKSGRLRDADVFGGSYVSLGHDALAKVAQIWRDQERDRRRTRNEIFALLGAVAILLIVGYFWLRAIDAKNKFEQQSKLNQAERLSSKAQVVYNTHPDLAFLLAATATELVDNSETRSGFMNVLERDPRLLAVLSGHPNGVCQTAFSPDGSTVATMDCSGTVHFWDTATYREKYPTLQMPSQETVLGIAILADNVRLAAAFRSGSIRFWNMQKGNSGGNDCRVADSPPAKDGEDVFSDSPRRVAFSPNGTRLAFIGSGQEIKLLQLEGCKSETLATPFTPVEINFAPNSSVLAVGGANGKSVAIDLATHKVVASLPLIPDVFSRSNFPNVDGEVVTAVALSPNSKQLAATYFGSEVQITTDKGNKKFQAQNSALTALAFSSNGASLAIGNSWFGELELWNSVREKFLQPLVAHSGGIGSLRSSPDNKTILSAGKSTFGVLWNLNSACRICSQIPGATAVGASLFAPDGRLFVTTYAPGGPGPSPTESKLQVWNGAVLQPIGVGLFGRQMNLSEDGKRLALLSNQIRLIDAATGADVAAPIPLGDDHFGGARMALSADGRLLAVAIRSAGSSTVKIRNIATGEEKTVAQEFPEVTALKFTPNSAVLLVADRNGTVTFWKSSTATEAYPAFKGHAPEHIWKRAAFSPDATTYVEGEDSEIRLWNLRSGKQVGSPLAQTGSSFDFAFTRDGKTLASGSDGGAIQLWDVATQQAFGGLLHAPGMIQHLEFSPDGKSLVSVQQNGGAMIWTLDSGKWRDIAKHIVNRNLSQQEWIQYFGTEPYKKTFADLPDGK